MLGQQNGPQLLHRPVHRVVDDKVVEITGHGELLLAPLQAAADLLHILGTPADEPALQLRPAGRGHVDADGLGPPAVDLLGPLDLDVQYHVPALVHGLIHIELGGPVQIPHKLRVL